MPTSALSAQRRAARRRHDWPGCLKIGAIPESASGAPRPKKRTRWSAAQGGLRTLTNPAFALPVKRCSMDSMSSEPTVSLVSGADPIAAAFAAASRYPDVNSILEVCARTTGMGYCVVAHVTEERWLACAVLDEIGFGLPSGGELPIKSTLCNEVRECRETIAFDQASADPRWRDHPTPRTYGLESYIAAPIILADGEFFGTLCAIDPKPAPASRSDIVKMFDLFAKMIATHLDAEKRVAASEAALLDAQATAELREQFIAVLGHDLRNPLAALDGGMELLRRRVAPERGAGPILDEMNRASARMRRLINDVLDFARGRLGGGLMIARRPSVDLTATVLQTVDELAMAHPDRAIYTDIAPKLVVESDPDRIAQLVSNLLANAISHGEPSIPIRVAAKLEAGILELSVANGGQPIPLEVRPKLFRPFHRGEHAGRQDGLGLGLYIASQIAAAHGGELTTASDDVETRFVFRMPVSASRLTAAISSNGHAP